MKKRWYRRFLVIVLLFGIFVGGGLSIQSVNRLYLKEEVSSQTVSNDLLKMCIRDSSRREECRTNCFQRSVGFYL